MYRLLKETMQSAEELSEGSDFEITLRDLRVSEELKMKIDELRDLYMQDKNKYLRDKEPLLTSKSLTLYQAVMVFQCVVCCVLPYMVCSCARMRLH